MNTKSIDTMLEEIAKLNVDTVEMHNRPTPHPQPLSYEAKEKVEEIIASFRIFLPHVKKQIDFAKSLGYDFEGKCLERLEDNHFWVYAKGYRSEKNGSIFPWKKKRILEYVLQLSFNLSQYNRRDSPKASVLFSIPQEDKDDVGTEVRLHSHDNSMVLLPGVADLIINAHQEASRQGSNILDYSKESFTERLLPYALSYVPALTVIATQNLYHELEQQKKRAEAVVRTAETNNDLVTKLKVPDLDETIQLLDQEKP